jgi:hypothetical protein
MSLDHRSARDEHSETDLPSTPSHVRVSAPGSTRASDDRILTVDWDGPDDPENPRKYALDIYIFSAFAPTDYFHVVGASARSGKQQSSCLRSRSLVPSPPR